MADDRDDIGPGLRAFLVVMIVVTTNATVLRFWSRSLTPREARQHVFHFWWDDWVALIASVIVIAQLAITIALIDHAGFGRHIDTLSAEEISLFFKLEYLGDYIYDSALATSKFSGLLFLSRVFPARLNSRWFNIALWVTHGLKAAWLIGVYFGTIFLCDPVQKGWNPFLPGTCGTTASLFLGSAIPSVVIDLIIMLLPLPKIWGLHTSIGRRVDWASFSSWVIPAL
ncbi:Uu.00g028510.m01.CDS01 [Anthostomella pinea]|uniref:Uu.00g028510.m01.CDS01 n=1 Tax=Anthostomella pinea TaxID=933095 RepID=A0AAI8YCX9_9PEZI|nr:Uu.00g028510.m01.CDS01 [Anthostomella pinea]